jgi:hypothetical protein
MGFTEEVAVKAIYYGKALTIQDCLTFLLPNENGLMDHKFVPTANSKERREEGLCILCVRKRKHQAKRTIEHFNET